jgi:hypothetical protein
MRAKPMKMPAMIAMPPERGTGRRCSERWLGTSRGSRSPTFNIPTTNSTVTSADAIGETKATSGIATDSVRSRQHGTYSSVFPCPRPI